MKSMLVIVLLLALTTGCGSKYNRGTYDLYLIPEGYEGIIRVNYNIDGAPQLQREGEYDVIHVNESGKAETSTPTFDYGTVIDQYYYVDEEGNRTEIDPLCVNARGTGGSEFDGKSIPHTEIEVTRSACGEDFQVNGS
ncbi:DUF6843 domain-containing protein [Paenibacillus spongiae]|uniref:DUF6843 domain-containing protein n=1 Tax=Paenibacillus spongiae TaxID=2909671 RepID=A0ABY5S6L7_9BACL|nr:hypothetical protein [Paenibacillus spongiae]UVI29561.1 hypothetical protein L1F29_29775 [Paenibacillus spongiae]